MDNKYLQLDETKARLFEYSKEPKEGYEKHEPENGKSSYRKYHDEGVKGVLKFINEKDEEFKNGKVKKLSLVLDNGNTRYIISFNMLTQKGNMNQFVEQLIPILPNLKQNESYRVFPYEMESKYTDAQGNEKTGKNKGVSIYTWDLANDTKLLKVEKAHTFGKDGDIPAINWIKKMDMGMEKNIKDDEERRNYLYTIMQNSLIGGKPEENKPEAPKEQAKQPEKPFEPATNYREEEHDDLPF